jgi:hypothetical protein
MSEQRSNNSIAGQLIIALVVALIAVLGFAIYLIGSERLYTLALILVSGLVLAVIIAACAVAIRAWRKNDAPPVIERHFTDGTKTIIRETRVLDGRTIEAPKIYQLPAAPQGGQFPELLRAAYQAGRISPQSSVLGQPTSGYRPTSDDSEAELQPLDLGDEDGWLGDITTRRP